MPDQVGVVVAREARRGGSREACDARPVRSSSPTGPVAAGVDPARVPPVPAAPARASGGRRLRGGATRDLALAGAVLGWIPAVLVADRGVGLGGQRLLGVATWLLLLVLLRGEAPRTRAQVAVVVGFASLVEYTFAGWLGVYVYRLHNVPWFVPPGHGLVYLGALALGRSSLFRAHARLLVPVTVAAAAGYAVWGLFVSSRLDVLGAFWFGCLAWFLVRGRAPLVYVGAFLVVTYLELLGTHLGTWAWQPHDPVLGWVAIGNPPSGAAGGYGFFDAAALALAPRLERAVSRSGRRVARSARSALADGSG